MARREPTDIRLELRQLELIDRIFGLEAQLAGALAFAKPERDEIDAVLRENEGLRQQLAGLQRTTTWRAGRAVLAPGRALRKLIRRRT